MEKRGEEEEEENVKNNNNGNMVESTNNNTLTLTRRAWYDLPHHILELFLKSIPEAIDRPNLGRVCKAWRELKPPPKSSCCCCSSSFPALVHGPTMCKYIVIDEYVIRSCVGSCHGWLIIRMKKAYSHPEERFYLLNIYTKDTIQLPILRDYYFGWPEICLSCSPTHPDCIVVLFDATVKGFLFSKRGWNKWIESDCCCPCPCPPPDEQGDCVYHAFSFQGKLYALTHSGNLAAIDIDTNMSDDDPTTTTTTKLTLLPLNNSIYPTVGCKQTSNCQWIQSLTLGYTRMNYDWFLIESLGKLLAVRLYRRKKYKEIINLDVLELDFKTMSWIEMKKNLPGGGDQVLFLSMFSSFSISGSEIGIGNNNCIYVSDHVLGKIHRYDMHNQEMIVCTGYPRTALDRYKREFTMLDYRRLWVKPTFV